MRITTKQTKKNNVLRFISLQRLHWSGDEVNKDRTARFMLFDLYQPRMQ